MATVTLRPNADGTYLQCLIYPTTPTTHYDKVDEATPNDATDYIHSGFGDGLSHYVHDTFKKPASGIPAGSTINSVTVYSRGKVIATPGGLKAYWTESLLIGGTLYNGTVSHQDTAWTTRSTVWRTNPATGAAWTLSDVEALEFGAYLNDTYDAGGNETWAQVTAVWLVIDYTPPPAGKFTFLKTPVSMIYIG